MNFEVLQLMTHPYIHTHYYLTDEDVRLQGDAAEELCCHKCHTSVYIIYPVQPAIGQASKEVIDRMEKIRFDFQEKHKHCAGEFSKIQKEQRGYCLLVRLHTQIFDLRVIMHAS